MNDMYIIVGIIISCIYTILAIVFTLHKRKDVGDRMILIATEVVVIWMLMPLWVFTFLITSTIIIGCIIYKEWFDKGKI